MYYSSSTDFFFLLAFFLSFLRVLLNSFTHDYALFLMRIPVENSKNEISQPNMGYQDALARLYWGDGTPQDCRDLIWGASLVWLLSQVEFIRGQHRIRNGSVSLSDLFSECDSNFLSEGCPGTILCVEVVFF